MSSIDSSFNPVLLSDDDDAIQVSMPHLHLESQKRNQGTKISIGNVGHVMIGNNAKLVVTSNGPSKSSYRPKAIPAQLPLSNSQEPLTMDQKLDIKDRVGIQWKDLGRRLGFCDSELEQLELDCTGNSSEVIYQILTRWEQRYADRASQGALASVFIKMKRGDLADLLSHES